MQKFLQQKTCELLAKERSESERAFILKVLTRKGRKTAAARSEAAVGEGRAATVANPDQRRPAHDVVS
jgi:hypothetical protein